MFRRHGRSLEAPTVGRVTVSAGIAMQRSDEDIVSTIARADETLHEAKRLGRDRVSTSARQG